MKIPMSLRPSFAACALAALLAACGGDGGGINPTAVGVLSATASEARYGQDVLITLEGRNLDGGISLSSSGCRTLTRSTASPNVSTATTAYYVCARPSPGSHAARFTRQADSVVLATVPFTIAQPQVTLTVSNGAGVSGDVVIALEAAKVPTTVDNFLAYVASGFYVDTAFHRVIPGAFLQGGGYARPLDPAGALPELKATNAAIVLEDNAGLSNLKYTVAMARTDVFNSATSQFFFNLADNTFLDRTDAQRGYAVFGTVTLGTELVDAMATAPCSAWPAFFGAGDPTACVPLPNLVITAAAQTR
jgi:cyclophilin family peptidyl-prolyl cis-trans isomerase